MSITGHFFGSNHARAMHEPCTNQVRTTTELALARCLSWRSFGLVLVETYKIKSQATVLYTQLFQLLYVGLHQAFPFKPLKVRLICFLFCIINNSEIPVFGCYVSVN